MTIRKGTAALVYPNGKDETVGYFVHRTPKSPPGFFLHGSAKGGWTVSDPVTGLAFMHGFPTRKAACDLISDLAAVLRKHKALHSYEAR